MLVLLLAAAIVPPTPVAERSVTAAVQVVRNLNAALNRRDFRQAYALWSGGHGYAAYRAGYRHTVRTRVIPIGPFTAEGGMGHSWAEVRVRVDALLDTGRHQHFTGSYRLSRVNDIDGSTAAQRRWHIVSAKLVPVPAGG